MVALFSCMAASVVELSLCGRATYQVVCEGAGTVCVLAFLRRACGTYSTYPHVVFDFSGRLAVQ